MMKVIGLYKAKIKRIGPKSELTGIYKYSINSVEVDKLGIIGDIQVDKRFHGGPERALHQYALSSYEKIIKRYPLLHKKACLGSIGENLCINSMDEQNVHIGDIYQMGEITIQVSGPRMPCFKIAEKFNTPGLEKFIAKYAIHGWYYRVLEEGTLSINDKVSLVTRPNPDLSVAGFLEVVQGKATDENLIDYAINAEGLDPEWKDKLKKKYQG